MLQQWLTSFETDPAKYSVPYSVTLAPIAIANGPIPPNAADIQHAQDVLVLCAKQRSQILDGLNNMDYIAQHPGNYDYTPPTTPADIVKAFVGYQHDLDVVAEAASYAIDHVIDAMGPADFAVKSGKVYPQGVPPTPMPTVQKGATDSLAAYGEVLVNQDPLAGLLRDQQPEGPTRKGFFTSVWPWPMGTPSWAPARTPSGQDSPQPNNPDSGAEWSSSSPATRMPAWPAEVPPSPRRTQRCLPSPAPIPTFTTAWVSTSRQASTAIQLWGHRATQRRARGRFASATR